ncbi:MAG: nucleoside-diphosphate kinase [Candidatus Anstonellales archaeon]
MEHDDKQEITVVLLKPDALNRALVGEIIKRLEQKGLKIVAIKMTKMSKELTKEHYSHLLDKPFYKSIEDFMTSGPIIAIAFKGPNAIEVVRLTIGATNPQKAQPGTIRADFAIDTGRNLIHASDSKETAEKELKRFFKKEELFDYERDIDKWIYE